MSTLLRASELVKLPVVTFAGEAIGQIKDIVYAPDGGQISAFTLAGRGLFSGALHTAVPWTSVIGLGPDALIIESEDRLVALDQIRTRQQTTGPSRGDILNSQVLTDRGTALGVVSDVIIAIGGPTDQADIVGYQIDPADTLDHGRQPLLIPLPDTLAASGKHLIVPAAAADYLTDDLAQFGGAVDAFRTQIGGPR